MRQNLRLFCVVLLLTLQLHAQQTATQLEAALKRLEADEQFAASTIAMYVVNSKTGQLIYQKNGQTGMAPASCQKIVTSVTAFEILGKDFRYKTTLSTNGSISNGRLFSDLIITGSGDPTLGSWRYALTREESIISRWSNAVQKHGITAIEGRVRINQSVFNTATIPDGWIWQDIGNYYGAGAAGFNWRENQFDLSLSSDNNIGDKVTISSTTPRGLSLQWTNELRAAAKGSGDNAYIYIAPYTKTGFLRGTIPIAQNNFVISGAMPDPAAFTAQLLTDRLTGLGIPVYSNPITAVPGTRQEPLTLITTESPALDSINYWFLKKSVNLYGEALLKTIAAQKQQPGNTDSGIAIIRNFWAKNGIKKSELKLMDGCGLSPQNRVTTRALVTIMQYARAQEWFSTYFNALPEINGIRMKDGYINGVRSYTGYTSSKDGNFYTFAFIVNNFDGNPGTVREKMWKVLDLLK